MTKGINTSNNYFKALLCGLLQLLIFCETLMSEDHESKSKVLTEHHSRMENIFVFDTPTTDALLLLGHPKDIQNPPDLPIFLSNDPPSIFQKHVCRAMSKKGLHLSFQRKKTLPFAPLAELLEPLKQKFGASRVEPSSMPLPPVPGRWLREVFC